MGRAVPSPPARLARKRTQHKRRLKTPLSRLCRAGTKPSRGALSLPPQDTGRFGALFSCTESYLQLRHMTAYILNLSCPDRQGIVHAVSGFLLERQGNIEEAAQYNDPDTGLVLHACAIRLRCRGQDALRAQLATFADTFGMKWSLHDTTQPMRTVLMVSKEGHCLNDLLFRVKSGLLPLDIRAIISNHREFYQLAASYNVPFHHIPVTAATKAQAEAKAYEVIEAEGC